jgi:hypothetical protein
MGQALKGQMILTDQRFVYIRYTGGKFLTAKAADYSDRIEEGLRNEGSFAIPLSAVTEAKVIECGALRTSDTERMVAKACFH